MSSRGDEFFSPAHYQIYGKTIVGHAHTESEKVTMLIHAIRTQPVRGGSGNSPSIYTGVNTPHRSILNDPGGEMLVSLG